MATMLNPNAIQNGSITQDKIASGQVTEPKLDADLTTKVNNNVKVVEQVLTGAEIDIASKNLKFRDANGNFFADRKSYDAVAKLSIVPKFSMFGNNCFSNTFGEHCSYNTFGNSFWGNTLGGFCEDNTFGVYCNSNIFGNDCSNNIFGSNCSNNIFGSNLQYSKIDNAVIYIELKSNATSTSPLKNIHILSGVRGKSKTERLVINIPDEYLNSSRELIITTKVTNGGPSTPEDIVMYYADEVVDKQNKQDNTLATTSKEVVGAINEVYNGGVKDTSIVGAKLADYTVTATKIAPRTIIGDNIQNKTIRTEQIADNAITTENIKEYAVTSDKIKDEAITGYKIPNETILERHLGYWAVTKNKIASGQVTLDKLASSVQDTLKMVGTNIKVLPAGTDLLSDNIEEGVHILLPTGSGTYPNFPYSMNLHPGATAILVKAGDSSIILGVDTSSSDELPLLLKRRNGGNWYGTSIYNKINSKLDASAGAVKTANLANGAVSSDKIADGAVISTKLSDFLQDKVKMVGMNVKVLPDGTDLLSEDLEEGIYVVDCSKMTNVPSSITKSDYDYALSLLIVDREHKRVMMLGPDTNSTKYPTCAYRHLVQKSWNNTPDSIYSKLMSLQLGVDDSVKKRDDNLATTSKEVISAINEIFNGGVKDKSIEAGKLTQAVQDTLGKVGTNVKEVKSGEDLFSLEDGIYSLNGSTYTNYPIGIPFDASAVCILVVTHSNQRVTLYGVDGSHSSPILPLVAIGDLENKIWRGGSFYSFFASDYEVGQVLDQKLDNTSTLTDAEVNNIWDNN